MPRRANRSSSGPPLDSRRRPTCFAIPVSVPVCRTSPTGARRWPGPAPESRTPPGRRRRGWCRIAVQPRRRGSSVARPRGARRRLVAMPMKRSVVSILVLGRRPVLPELLRDVRRAEHKTDRRDGDSAGEHDELAAPPDTGRDDLALRIPDADSDAVRDRTEWLSRRRSRRGDRRGAGGRRRRHRRAVHRSCRA